MEFVSHVGQDRWVVEVYKELRGGVFLDFGAFDGVTTSNTFYLERSLGWVGICVEPNPFYFPALCQHRSSIAINAALWPEGRRQLLLEDAHGMSKLVDVSGDESIDSTRASLSRGFVHVDTVNPAELLRRFNLTSEIHYMSLDVEGCELQVLESMDLEHYSFGLISVEHNHHPGRKEAVRNIMIKHGYDVAELRNDDLFYNLDIVAKLSHGVFEHPEHVCDRVANSYIVP